MPNKKKKIVKNGKPRRIFWLIAAAALLIILSFFLAKQKAVSAPPESKNNLNFDFGNRTIDLNHKQISFYNGLHKSTDNYGFHSANISDRTVSLMGSRAAAILVDSPGGSGMFYYLISAMQVDGKEVYSKPVLLGDRIKITSVKVNDPGMNDNGQVEVRYLDRPQGAPMAEEPTVETLTKFAFEEDGNLISSLR